MELELIPVHSDDPLCEAARELYEASFPENERRLFSELFSDFHGQAEMFAFLDGETFVGMADLLSFGDLTHILYLAVEPRFRDRGYGSGILALLRERYAGQRIIADVERPEEKSPNEDQREKRAAFYLKNGYCFTDILYRWEGEDYRIMSNGGNVTRDEFSGFWRFFYSM